ncbi:MAG TPA: VCBS repeat-containing protein, partial [Thermoguttaceae bacterium]|nr:VCBS repeat-containing protein [Thermoguttaceae bacterium]
IQVDNYSVPSLADWNADGRLDLIVGQKTDLGEGKVSVYLNVGTATHPDFDLPFYATLAGSDVIAPGSGCLGVFPRVFDWDQDGRKDLVIGRADGKVQVLLNTHTDADPQFDTATFLQVGLPGSKSDIDVGNRATLDIVDYNNDGQYDLVLGALDGRVRVYLNEAAAGAADFQSELVVADGPDDLIVPSGRSSVAVYDLNGDGRKDLVLGNTEGQMLFYANTGSDAQPTFDGSQPLRANGEIINLTGTPRSRPFVGDFDGDQIADLLIGSADGLVRLYTGRPEAAAGRQEDIIDGEPGGQFVHTFFVATSEIIPGVTISPTTDLWTTEDHGTAQFTVVLDSMPEGTVTIGLSSDNTDEGTVDPSEVTFNAENWHLPQTVTVTGQDDTLLEGDVAYTIVTATATGTDPHYLGFDADDIAIVNRDNEVGLLGRHIFYNNSHFDGYTPGPSESDDAAVAPDPDASSDPSLGKTALLPGQVATLQNYTTYSRGINGIMIDIVNLPGPPDASDFRFMVGNSSNPDAFSAAPLPLSITVRPRAGVAGADRVTLIWADNVIEKQWLQVTVQPTEHRGLVEPDVFYFGNAPGEAGDQQINTIVNATDEIVARNFQHSAVDPALIDDPYDYNRDGLVNGTDQIIARNNQTNPLTMLRLIEAPTVDLALKQVVMEDQHGAETLSAALDWQYEFQSMQSRDSM